MSRANYLDASVAVKLVLNEPESSAVRAYFAGKIFFMTDLCFAETLGVLKSKRLRKKITTKQYTGGCYLLIKYLHLKLIQLDQMSLRSFDIFLKTEHYAQKHGLDLSDALQLVAIKYGTFRGGENKNKTLLITGDKQLEIAAQAEGLEVWNCVECPTPP